MSAAHLFAPPVEIPAPVQPVNERCAGKMRFQSAALAHQVNQRRAGTDKAGEVYLCPACAGWHLGRSWPAAGRQPR